MELPNVVAIAKEMQLFVLLRRLRRFGRFDRTPFRQVLTGRVADIDRFLESLEAAGREEPGFLEPLQRLVPLHETFVFLGEEEFRERLRGALAAAAPRMAGETFHVRFARRGAEAGSAGIAVERDSGEILVEELRRLGRSPKVRFDDPDTIVAVETAGAAGGIGILTRDLRTRHGFLRAR